MSMASTSTRVPRQLRPRPRGRNREREPDPCGDMPPPEVVRASWLLVGVGGLNTPARLPPRAWRDGLEEEVDDALGEGLTAPVQDWWAGVLRPHGASASVSTRRWQRGPVAGSLHPRAPTGEERVGALRSPPLTDGRRGGDSNRGVACRRTACAMARHVTCSSAQGGGARGGAVRWRVRGGGARAPRTGPVHVVPDEDQTKGVALFDGEGRPATDGALPLCKGTLKPGVGRGVGGRPGPSAGLRLPPCCDVHLQVP